MRLQVRSLYPGPLEFIFSVESVEDEAFPEINRLIAVRRSPAPALRPPQPPSAAGLALASAAPAPCARLEPGTRSGQRWLCCARGA
jgi:hypothetical protein